MFSFIIVKSIISKIRVKYKYFIIIKIEEKKKLEHEMFSKLSKITSKSTKAIASTRQAVYLSSSSSSRNNLLNNNQNNNNNGGAVVYTSKSEFSIKSTTKLSSITVYYLLIFFVVAAFYCK